MRKNPTRPGIAADRTRAGHVRFLGRDLWAPQPPSCRRTAGRRSRRARSSALRSPGSGQSDRGPHLAGLHLRRPWKPPGRGHQLPAHRRGPAVSGHRHRPVARRMVVGWAVADHMRASPTTRVLNSPGTGGTCSPTNFHSTQRSTRPGKWEMVPGKLGRQSMGEIGAGVHHPSRLRSRRGPNFTLGASAFLGDCPGFC
jgi:hypothetical protein